MSPLDGTAQGSSSLRAASTPTTGRDGGEDGDVAPEVVVVVLQLGSSSPACIKTVSTGHSEVGCHQQFSW